MYDPPVDDQEYLHLKGQEMIEKLQSEIEQLRKAQEWIPVGERLPEINQIVLIYVWGFVRYAEFRDLSHKKRWFRKGDETRRFCIVGSNDIVVEGNPTHWLPLPAPPGQPDA